MKILNTLPINNSKLQFITTNETLCPFCHQKSNIVPSSAVNHFIRDDLKKNISSLEGFRFCDNKICQVVYFKKDITIKQSQIKYSIGIKEGSKPATICFCFNWTKEKIKKQIDECQNSTALIEIKKNMNNGLCNCEVNNPRGKCCMKDIKKTIDEIKVNYI